jgi:hypothetical protein
VIDIFEQLSTYLEDSLTANIITSTMLETYAVVALQVCDILTHAAKYAKLGSSIKSFCVLLTGVGYYWTSRFDHNDGLRQLTVEFNHRASPEIRSQISEISSMLEKQSLETAWAIDVVAQEVRALRQVYKVISRISEESGSW